MKNESALRGKNKKKAMKATWDDDNKNESDEVQEEVANMCFMVIHSEVKSLELDNDVFLMILLMRNPPLMNSLMISMIYI